MNERTKIRRKVVTGLFAAPSFLIPTMLGATAMLASWATQLGGAWLTFGGALSILAGFGALATRLIFGMDSVSRDAADELRRETEDQGLRQLDDLDQRLEGDEDQRSEDLLRELRALNKALQEQGLPGRLDPASRVDITIKVRELFEGSIRALEKGLTLWDTAQEIPVGAGRQALLEQREIQLREVEQCVSLIRKLCRAEPGPASAEAPEGELARIRDELNQSLEVAKRVEERMESLEKDIHGTPEWGG